MLRLLPRRSNDVTYFTNDPALELDGLRSGGPGWWLRGSGDTQDPRDVARALTTTERSALFGYDLVIAAPRPLSILLAVDPAHARGVVDAHRVSVRAAIEYLEDRALVVRDRRGGTDVDVTARWENIVSFTHGLNRHGEPHLHDHVLVGARPQHTNHVLDARGLYAHAATADALYRASFRFELAERTPWSAWRSFEGVERVVGLDEGYRALWGGHHRERGEKLSWSREETMASWSRDRERFEALGERESNIRDPRVLDEHVFSGAFEGRSDVTRRHLVSAWANAASRGQRAQDVIRSVDTIYPSLLEGRGVREISTNVAHARQIAMVREHGPRPLGREEFDAWRQRSFERVRSRDDRSR